MAVGPVGRGAPIAHPNFGPGIWISGAEVVRSPNLRLASRVGRPRRFSALATVKVSVDVDVCAFVATPLLAVGRTA